MSGAHSLVVPATHAGSRVDLFVGEALGLSRAKLKKLFEEGAVQVNGRVAKKGVTLTEGQRVEVTLAEEPSTDVTPQPDLPLHVLHQDAALIFVDKPSGQPSHPLQPGEQGTVANALLARFPECSEASTDPREAGLCHRLDVETSGVLLAARNRPAWEVIRTAFTQREVDKHYWALVTGPLGDEGEIDLPLRHHPKRADRVEAAVDGIDAREAISRFRVLSRSGEYALVEVQILTGVLHQVRAHLAAIGAPIVGDALYGGRDEPGLQRFFLHARSLALRHPETEQRLRVTSELPPELLQVLERRALQPDVGSGVAPIPPSP